jgi:hypothetical protein
MVYLTTLEQYARLFDGLHADEDMRIADCAQPVHCPVGNCDVRH